MVNRERVSLIDSSEREGRWLMSTRFFFLSGHPLFDGHPVMHRGRHLAPPVERYFE